MPDGMDYLMRPVLAQVLHFESLLDGTVDLEHVALLNYALGVEYRNQKRLYEAAQSKK